MKQPTKLKPFGYTLIEIVVILAILGVLLLLGLEQYQAFTARQKLRSAGNYIVSDILRGEEAARRISISGSIQPNQNLQNSTVLLGSNNQLIFSHSLQIPITATSTGFVPLPCVGAAALQISGPGTSGGSLAIPFNVQGIPTQCDGTRFPSENAVQRIILNQGAVVITLDTRTGMVQMTGP